ncbi:hypothetical protein TPA0907_56090 [Micromonospora humidisoli]|uniref:hypothetical protein n=1 Tax=Micromonospora sp. AKA109 TaxID=2733865 RepID=UPI0022CC8E0E|nr:hypothetical protein [Micromonospora sp. AKA109]GHJ11242.1 hypothetical protein TPA0907_56090 [Micromonospora sp. AKA109]
MPDRDVTRRLARDLGVNLDGLPQALEREERARADRQQQLDRARAITAAHNEGRHCGGDCGTCQAAGRIL